MEEQSRTYILEASDLSVSFETDAGEVQAVRDVSLSLKEGEVLAIVGESGCGKSVLCKSLMKMLPGNARIKSGKILANGIDIRKFGSQGQQRTAALSLKLSEIYLVKKKIRDTPVLLLDDVLSELDSSRQTYLLESIHDIQTLITCTGLDDFVSHQFKINRVFQVVKGHVYMPKGF